MGVDRHMQEDIFNRSAALKPDVADRLANGFAQLVTAIATAIQLPIIRLLGNRLFDQVIEDRARAQNMPAISLPCYFQELLTLIAQRRLDRPTFGGGDIVEESPQLIEVVVIQPAQARITPAPLAINQVLKRGKELVIYHTVEEVQRQHEQPVARRIEGVVPLLNLAGIIAHGIDAGLDRLLSDRSLLGLVTEQRDKVVDVLRCLKIIGDPICTHPLNSFISNIRYNGGEEVRTMRSVRETPTEYVVPSAQETEQAKESSRLLARRIQRGHSLSVRVVNDTPQEQEVVIRLPAKAVQLLQTILVQMAEGKAVTIIPTHAEITTQQAADILNVSRPFFVRLIERGDISFRKVGTHRRVLLSDVMVYKQRTDNAREQSLDELTALSQELNLGY